MKKKEQYQEIPPEIHYEEDYIDLYELFTTVWAKRKFILIFCSVLTVLTAIVSLIMSDIYMADTTLLPISSKSSIIPAGISDIASLAGLSLGGSSDDTLKIMAVLNSRTLKEQVITELNLIDKIFKDDIDEDRNPMLASLEEFEDMITISSDKETSLITLSIEYEDPNLVKQMCDSFVKNLKDNLNTKSLLVNSLQREFYEKQLQEAEVKLQKAQNEMITFQKKTGIVDVQQGATGGIQILTDLMTKRTEMEIKVKSMEAALAPESPILKSFKSQLHEINKKLNAILKDDDQNKSPYLKNIPEKLSNYADYYRELEVAKTIYKTLLGLYEQSKLEEAKEGIYVQVIDPAVVPDEKIKPKRAIMVIVAAVASFILSIFIIFFKEWLKDLKLNIPTNQRI